MKKISVLFLMGLAFLAIQEKGRTNLLLEGHPVHATVKNVRQQVDTAVKPSPRNFGIGRPSKQTPGRSSSVSLEGSDNGDTAFPQTSSEHAAELKKSDLSIINASMTKQEE